MAGHTFRELFVNPGTMRLKVAGFALRYPLMLTLVTVNTEQQAMFGRRLFQRFTGLHVTAGALLGPQIILVDNPQWRMWLMTAAAVSISLGIEMCFMTFETTE